MDKLQIIKLITIILRVLTLVCIMVLYFLKSYDLLLVLAVLQSVSLIVSDLKL